jgi:hypothetical protein
MGSLGLSRALKGLGGFSGDEAADRIQPRVGRDFRGSGGGFNEKISATGNPALLYLSEAAQDYAWVGEGGWEPVLLWVPKDRP